MLKDCSYLGVRGTFFHFELPGKENVNCSVIIFLSQCNEFNTDLRYQSTAARKHLLTKTLRICCKSFALKGFWF